MKPDHPLSRTLPELVNLPQWQTLQDNFANVIDICLRTLSPDGTPLTDASREPRLCREIVKDPLQKARLCGRCLPTFMGGEAVVDKNLGYFCHANLYNFIAPLRLEGTVIAYVLIGPVILVMRKSKEEYRSAAEALGVSLDEFWSALLEIKVISFQGVNAFVALIQTMGDYLLALAYENRQMRQLSGQYLQRLLDVALEISGAAIGSVMLYDPQSATLSIRASRGIPEEIVEKTRVKIGEGIAGTALESGESFVIDERTPDRRIRPYLSRPYLNSSMVLPLKVADKVLGVMNLGILKTAATSFTPERRDLVRRLLSLANFSPT